MRLIAATPASIMMGRLDAVDDGRAEALICLVTSAVAVENAALMIGQARGTPGPRARPRVPRDSTLNDLDDSRLSRYYNHQTM